MYIDIIIPCKNPNHQLISTIKSLTKVKVISKILVIDDFSNKGKKIFNQIIKFKKVSVKKNIFKNGISGALNSGIYFSNNKLIGRIDSGDICLKKDRFDKIIKIFNENKNVDLICTGLIDSKAKVITPKLYFLDDILTPFSRVPHPTWVLRKESIKFNYKNNCFRFEDYAFLLDNKFKIKIFNQNDTKYENTIRLKRWTEISVSFNKSLYFIKKSTNKLFALFISISYMVFRFIRLLLSTKKIFF